MKSNSSPTKNPKTTNPSRVAAKENTSQEAFEKSLVLGFQVNGYCLKQVLSSSAMSKTFKVTKDNCDYALKVVAAEFAQHAKRQIDVLKKLQECRYFTRIVDTFEYVGLFCFVTEFYESISLFEYVRKQPNRLIEAKEALVIFRHILSGVLEMHSNQVLHRNLKLENILIMKEGNEPRICGLGLSRELDSDEMTWSLCGTPSYLAPELLCGQPYDYKMDVWALGTLLFAMTTGQLPFGSHSTKKNQLRHIRLACTPVFNFSNAKSAGMKYPERLDFGSDNHNWESLFRGFFEERPSKRFTYAQMLNHTLISPILGAEFPKMYEQNYEKLDEILSSVIVNVSNRYEDNYSSSSDLEDETEHSEAQVNQMIESKMIASAANFTSPEFMDHVSIYRFEIEKYLTLSDIRSFLNTSRVFNNAVPRGEKYLTMYFIAQRMLYQARWIQYILEKNINQFKLDKFDKFAASKTYSEILSKVKRDCQDFDKLMVESYQLLKEERIDSKLPENISASVTEYIFIDFNKGDYKELPPQFKLPYRAVLTQVFAKVYTKVQKYLSFDEKLLSNVEGIVNMDRDKKREFCTQEAKVLLRVGLRLLVAALINRILKNRGCTLTEIPSTRHGGQFELNLFLDSMTLATYRQSKTTIKQLFQKYLPHLNLSELAKQKFF